MSSFYNSIHHSITIYSIFFKFNKNAYNFQRGRKRRKHVVETTPLTIKLSKWYDIYQFIKQKNIFMLVNFLFYIKEIEKRILNKSQSDPLTYHIFWPIFFVMVWGQHIRYDIGIQRGRFQVKGLCHFILSLNAQQSSRYEVIKY